MKYNKNALSLAQNFLNLEMAILASKRGKMAYHFRYNVNKALNMIQRMFYLYPDISPIISGLVRKRALRNWVRTMNYFKLP